MSSVGSSFLLVLLLLNEVHVAGSLLVLTAVLYHVARTAVKSEGVAN